MSVRSSFFTSQAGDRVYDSTDFARRFKDFIGDGIVVPGGGVLGTQMQVTAVGGNLQTTTNLGIAIAQGYTVEVYSSPQVLTHATADGVNPRIDRVVVEISTTTSRIGTIKILQGTPAGSPVAPALTRNADIWQLSLAQVLVGAGVIALTNGNITDERPNASLCGLANITVGITAPTGNSAVTVTVDNTNFNTITGTNQQAVDDSIDNVLAATKTDIDIARRAILDTGSANAYVVDTQGVFDLTLDGNILTFIPNNTNTGASTINPDGQGVRTIQKADSTGTPVALEAGDLLKNRPTQLVRRVGTNVFILRPSGGSNIKSIQKGSGTMLAGSTTLSTTITGVDLSKSIVILSISSSASNTTLSETQVSGQLTSSTNINFQRIASSATIKINWFVIEFNNVKSLQRGSVNSSATSFTQAISSVVVEKSVLFFSQRTGNANADAYNVRIAGTITSNVLLTFEQESGINRTPEWQVIEFN